MTLTNLFKTQQLHLDLLLDEAEFKKSNFKRAIEIYFNTLRIYENKLGECGEDELNKAYEKAREKL